MNRRGFIGSILALAAAPAIVRADSLMRVVPRDTVVWTASGGEFYSFEPNIDPDLLRVMRAADRLHRDVAGIQERWQKEIVERFYQATVFGQTCIKEYPDGRFETVDLHDVYVLPRVGEARDPLPANLELGQSSCLFPGPTTPTPRRLLRGRRRA